MKKSYSNPIAKTANVKLRTTILAGSNQTLTNGGTLTGNEKDPVYADSRTRNASAGSID